MGRTRRIKGKNAPKLKIALGGDFEGKQSRPRDCEQTSSRKSIDLITSKSRLKRRARRKSRSRPKLKDMKDEVKTFNSSDTRSTTSTRPSRPTTTSVSSDHGHGDSDADRTTVPVAGSSSGTSESRLQKKSDGKKLNAQVPYLIKKSSEWAKFTPFDTVAGSWTMFNIKLKNYKLSLFWRCKLPFGNLM